MKPAGNEIHNSRRGADALDSVSGNELERRAEEQIFACTVSFSNESWPLNESQIGQFLFVNFSQFLLHRR